MRRPFFLSCMAAAVFVAAPAAAQQCDDFNQSVVTGKGQTQQFLRPYDGGLLLKNPDAIRCLIDIIATSGPRVAAGAAADDDLARLIQATGGLRTILVNGGREAIRNFRRHDSLDAVSALTALARGENQTLRVNSAVILADVIDNSGLCVVIDHLYDPALGETEYGKSGRVNLISIASVVAPWAYRENFGNLLGLIDYLGPILEKADDARRASELFRNLVERTEYQRSLSDAPMNQPLPEESRDCYRYSPAFANRDGQKRLVYGQ